MIFGFANRNVVSFLAGAATVMSAVLFYNWTTLDSNPAALPVIHRRKRVVCFGDSITQHGFNTEISGWVAMLAHWWSRRVDVINRGFSGYNSKWARIIVNEAVVPLNPDMVIIFFGANDAVDSSVLQHVPLDQYSDNIRFIVNVIRKETPNAKLILITPPPIWEEKLQYFNSNKGKPLLIDRTNERTLRYVQACLDLGTELNVPVVNAWVAMEGSSSNRADYLSDGLHLSERGCAQLFAAIKSTILEHFPSWNPETMNMDWPEWSKFESSLRN